MKPFDKALGALLVALILVRVTGAGASIGGKLTGPALVVIIHETADTNTERARMITALRNGPAAEYLKSKGHSLLVIDDDAIDANGLGVVKPDWITGSQLPVVVVLDNSGRVAYREPLPATADLLLESLKGKGL